MEYRSGAAKLELPSLVPLDAATVANFELGAIDARPERSSLARALSLGSSLAVASSLNRRGGAEAAADRPVTLKGSLGAARRSAAASEESAATRIRS
ncbi:MAG TPA: hypothetical protein VGH32_05825, partial [Pirellulales bacterium]